MTEASNVFDYADYYLIALHHLSRRMNFMARTLTCSSSCRNKFFRRSKIEMEKLDAQSDTFRKFMSCPSEIPSTPPFYDHKREIVAARRVAYKIINCLQNSVTDFIG